MDDMENYAENEDCPLPEGVNPEINPQGEQLIHGLHADKAHWALHDRIFDTIEALEAFVICVNRSHHYERNLRRNGILGFEEQSEEYEYYHHNFVEKWCDVLQSADRMFEMAEELIEVGGGNLFGHQDYVA